MRPPNSICIAAVPRAFLFARVPPRVCGPERPAEARQLQRDDADREQPPPIAPAHQIGPHKQEDPQEADHQADRATQRQSFAVGQHRFNAGHPERRARDDDGGDAAGHPLLRPDDAAVSHPNHQETE
jgi:hypothetical protein